jgi:hypothetical protein
MKRHHHHHHLRLATTTEEIRQECKDGSGSMTIVGYLTYPLAHKLLALYAVSSLAFSCSHVLSLTTRFHLRALC